MKTALVILALLLLAACQPALEFETLDKGQVSDIAQQQNRVIRSQQELDALQLTDSPVDFSQKMVLAVFMGQKNTGGYDIEITSIESNDQLEVHYRETFPESGAFLTQAITSPYHLVTVPRSEKQVTFISE